MPSESWTLLDVEQDICADHLEIGPGDLGTSMGDWSVKKSTLRGGLRDGVDLVQIACGDLAVDIVPTRGMGIRKAWLGGEEIGWQSPVRGPVHPAFVPLTEPGGLGWLDGFDELLVRCGLESNGAPDFGENGRLLYPLHGRVANRPAHKVVVSVDGEKREIQVTGVVEETRFHFAKLRLTSSVTVKFGEPLVRIRDEVQNLSGSAAGTQMLYHINFGQPLLDPGSQLIAPAETVVPRDGRAAEGIASWNQYAQELAGYAEEVYFLKLRAAEDGRTQTLLRNAEGTRGVSVHFDTAQLPCFTLWKNTVPSADGYATGLEPGTNFPNPRSHEDGQGRVVSLESGGTAVYDLALEIHNNAAAVERAGQAVADLQADRQTEVLDQPQPGWCTV
jgi:hypothetical protein